MLTLIRDFQIKRSDSVVFISAFHWDAKGPTQESPVLSCLQQDVSTAPSPASPLWQLGQGRAAPGPGPRQPAALSHLHRATLAHSSTRPAWNRMNTNSPRQSSHWNSLLRQLNWNLCRTCQHLTRGTSANFPCATSTSGFWSRCAHTLLTGALQTQENSHLVFTGKPHVCLWGFHGASTDPL